MPRCAHAKHVCLDYYGYTNDLPMYVLEFDFNVQNVVYISEYKIFTIRHSHNGHNLKDSSSG